MISQPILKLQDSTIYKLIHQHYSLYIQQIRYIMDDSISNIREYNTIEDLGENVYERVPVEYTEKELKRMKICRTRFTADIELKECDGDHTGYENQVRCAKEIELKLQNKRILAIMIIARTQSGKTGTMIEFLRQYISVSCIPIPIDNIYIITGLSSTEWKDQTICRFPECLRERIIHRNNLLEDNTIDEILKKRNVLIIMDEVQIAAKERQTIHKMFTRSGLYEKDRLLRQDIKILEFTATPDGTIYGVQDWGSHAAVIKMDPGKGYVGCDDLLDDNRVREYKDLMCHDDMTGEIDIHKSRESIQEIKELIDTRFPEPMYHIIRTGGASKSDDVVSNFRLIFPDMKYKMYHSNSEVYDLNKELLEIKPKEHTFIFIKERLRCAKTLHKKHLGIVYERFTTMPNDTVIIQGLLGRLTGYDDNKLTICFTHIDTISRYKTLYESSFLDKSTKWISNTTSRKQGELCSAGTYHDKKHFGEDDTESEVIIEDDTEYKVFEQQSDAILFAKTLGVKLNKRSKSEAPKDLQRNGENPSVEYLIKRMWGINVTKKARMIPTNDNKWCVYWRPSLINSIHHLKNN